MTPGAPLTERGSGLGGDDPEVRLRLYVARTTPNSERAEQNLKLALKEFEDGGAALGLEIVDVFTSPGRAVTDGVIVTPMLIGLKASGRLVMMGDLAETGKLRSLIQSMLDDRTMASLRALVVNKGGSLAQQEIVAVELQHRLKAQLHIVEGMLAADLQITSRGVKQEPLVKIIRRVAALIAVYGQLTGVVTAHTADLGEYITALCEILPELQFNFNKGVQLLCAADSVFADVKIVTIIGMVVAEAISDCFKSTRVGASGTIDVSLRRSEIEGEAILLVRDNSSEFTEHGRSEQHGVGLLHRLLEQVKGTLELSSDRGGIWTFRFPLSAGAAAGALVSL
jgi:two-component sensor histidine kinase